MSALDLFSGRARLRDLMESAVQGKLDAVLPVRPVLWMIALDAVTFPTNDEGTDLATTFATALDARRQEYVATKAEMMANPAEADDDPLLNNPLSFSESSAWASFYSHQDLLHDITKDIDRLFPDGCSTYFHTPRLKDILTAVLFVWCRLHPELSYRQGMHEILAVIIWTLENSDGSSKREESDGEVLTSPILEPVPISGALSNILSKSYVEHDAYVLFSAVMVHLGQLYVANDVYDEPPREGLSADEVAEFALSKSDAVGDEKPPIVLTLCNEIQHRRLRAADRAVHHNLAALTIEPQLYGLRWTRLLFCREFPMAVVHRLWDAMFAALYFKAQPDTSDSDALKYPKWSLLESVEWISTAMLLHIRESLVTQDYTTVLTALMRYPRVEDPFVLFQTAVDLVNAGGRLRPPTPPPEASVEQVLPKLTMDELLSLRPRLISFYLRFNPARVSNVDSILARYKGREEHLIQDLINVYGESPFTTKGPSQLGPLARVDPRAIPPTMVAPQSRPRPVPGNVVPRSQGVPHTQSLPQSSSAGEAPGGVKEKMMSGWNTLSDLANKALKAVVVPPDATPPVPAPHTVSQPASVPPVPQPVTHLTSNNMVHPQPRMISPLSAPASPAQLRVNLKPTTVLATKFESLVQQMEAVLLSGSEPGDAAMSEVPLVDGQDVSNSASPPVSDSPVDKKALLLLLKQLSEATEELKRL